MLKFKEVSKEVYEFICKSINRQDKLDEFKTLLGNLRKIQQKILLI